MGVQHKLDNGSRSMAMNAGQNADFRRALAHDLGNLLQVVNGNLELLSSRIEDEKLRGYIANAQSAAEQMTGIAHTLVDPKPDETA